MGFVQRFKKNTQREGQAVRESSSFEDLSDDELAAHLGVSRYDDFELTDAVRPSYDVQITPRQGYRNDVYRDGESGVEIPVLMAAASRERMLDLFLDLLDPLGDEVDVVLETSHEQHGTGHHDLYREAIDLPVLKSILWDFEDLLLNDGCMGIAVLNPRIPLEVQLDEHKLFIMYGHDLLDFECTLSDHLVRYAESIKFITEAEHIHSSGEEHVRMFEQLRYRLGIDED